MKRFAATALVALALAACGGGDTDDPAATEEAATTADEATAATDEATTTAATTAAETPATDAAETEASETEDDDSATGESGEVQGIGAATVTIDGEVTTFAGTDFAAETCAPDRFGIFFAVLQQVDDTGAAVDGGLVEAIFLHDDMDAETAGQDNRIAVTLGDTEWIADVAEGEGQVDDVTVDGSSASATATLNGADGPAAGTLEVTCAPDG